MPPPGEWLHIDTEVRLAALGATVREVLASGAARLAGENARQQVFPVDLPAGGRIVRCFVKCVHRAGGSLFSRGLRAALWWLTAWPGRPLVERRMNAAAEEIEKLTAFEAAGFCGPALVAAGWLNLWREPSFLVTRDLAEAGFAPLMVALRAPRLAGERAAALARLGQWVAALHGAGLAHRDLYAWHVFADAGCARFAAIDLLRLARPSSPRALARLAARDLAGVRATVIEPLGWPGAAEAWLAAYFERAPEAIRSREQLCRRRARRRVEVVAFRKRRRLAAVRLALDAPGAGG
ncbi:MAG: hypothetical protein HY719_00195 [Planctomycetes bacterium]|nr:hypothetical protein [Planctomycetota bacterium]